MFMLGLAAAIAASIAFNLGIVLQALDAREAPRQDGLRLSLLNRLIRKKRWVAGFLLGGLGFALQVLALAFAPFVVVQPVLSIGLLLVLFLGVRMLGERVGPGEVLGVLGITGGIALLAWGAPAPAETVRSQAAVISVLAVMSVASLLPIALPRRRRRDAALVVIVASALAFGAGNVATKLISDELSGGRVWAAAIWLAVAGATSIWAIVTEMTALQRRQATLVVPLSFAVQTFLPVLIEPIYLVERWGTAAAYGVPLICGLLLVLMGAVAVSRSRAVSTLVAA